MEVLIYRAFDGIEGAEVFGGLEVV